MKRTQHLRLIGLGILASIACIIGGLSKTPVRAQTVDSYGFTIYTYIDSDGRYIYASSYFESDYTELDVLSSQAAWQVSGPSYSDPGTGESLTSGPVTPGYTYNVVFAYDIAYEYFNQDQYNSNCGLEDWCYGDAYPEGGGSIDVPYPPATVTGISPSDWIAGQSYQGVQITGTNFGSTPSVTLSDPAIQITRQAYNTSTSNGTSTTYIDISVPSDTPSEPVTVTVAPGSNGNSFTSGTGGSLSGSSTADVIGAQQNACPAALDANSGFSAIAPTGLVGSGTMTVSFSHGSYNGFGVTVPYGPYSTPESIASHMAALITKQYARSGLTAQAFGANILYKTRATLGNANFTPSDSSGASPSFTANPAPLSCPTLNLVYVLIVTSDSVSWVSSGMNNGRNVSYELSKWSNSNYVVNRPPMVSSQISEHLDQQMAYGFGSTSTVLGAFCDVLGNTNPTLTGLYDPTRYFTAIYTDPQGITHDLGRVATIDNASKPAANFKDVIKIYLPNGPSILNNYTNSDGTPKFIAIPQTTRLTKGPCDH